MQIAGSQALDNVPRSPAEKGAINFTEEGRHLYTHMFTQRTENNKL